MALTFANLKEQKETQQKIFLPNYLIDYKSCFHGGRASKYLIGKICIILTNSITNYKPRILINL